MKSQIKEVNFSKWKVVFLLAVFFFLLILDQTTKYYFKQMLDNSSMEVIPGFFELTYVENFGAAFGILSGNSYLLILATIIFSFCWIWAIHKFKDDFIMLSLLIVTYAGTIGNFIDRIVNGFVIDFLHFYNLPLIGNFAVFNFADVYLTLGLSTLAIYYMFKKE